MVCPGKRVLASQLRGKLTRRGEGFSQGVCDGRGNRAFRLGRNVIETAHLSRMSPFNIFVPILPLRSVSSRSDVCITTIYIFMSRTLYLALFGISSAIGVSSHSLLLFHR